jgi:hypothetical protein
VYRVLSRWRYRRHDLGEVFEADLEPDVETRAIELGVIELLERKTTSIAETEFTPPRDWALTQT